jgi:hypothetical protein
MHANPSGEVSAATHSCTVKVPMAFYVFAAEFAAQSA